MSEKYILGVDGGGTKTHCILYGIEDSDSYLFTFPTSNHESLRGGYTQLEKVIEEIVSIICSSRGISVNDIVSSCFNLSGVDFPYQEKLISNMIENTGLRNFLLRNDTFAGVKANCENGYGIAAVNGTGCCIAGINEKGESVQLGGLGDISGDIGGAHNMIRAAVCAVYDYLYRGGEETILSQELCKALSCDEKMITEKAFQSFEKNDEKLIRKMAIAVYTAADKNDKKAFDILERIGDYYVDNIIAVYSKLSFSPETVVPVTLIGTQFVKGENPAIINRIRSKIEGDGKPFRVSVSSVKPVVGSVLWAAENYGIPLDERRDIRAILEGI
jgi:N-acetylglucosamine kinase-like BadF-type ATPase